MLLIEAANNLFFFCGRVGDESSSHAREVGFSSLLAGVWFISLIIHSTDDG